MSRVVRRPTVKFIATSVENRRAAAYRIGRNGGVERSARGKAGLRRTFGQWECHVSFAATDPLLRESVLVLRASDALSTSLSQAATELTRDFHQALGCIDE
ncbi:hypothetical protein PF005_g3990 [Phytophthora fragariae]|uniref:Uncharacterized protein n=1 Tax=Phytophthora fragariae TaxID=53985 RepID=A0A6A3T7Q5_9STRA|nr:hypothetical protein PF003_g30670 [Phytophthora fragariae]KAE8945925.1 hypothetical protein PF009_g4434 [Phytophthora fragariae]KAE8991038.1 hypothetical protein PF011_g18103 [Phytophthora fragariae]KAE9096464.1 hypothetical protein PF010_g16337 [Phytophthora fragariae]KAE9131317.1 hypothetical protein PF007_g4181 [Phytophthora fragariae]